MRWTQLPLAAAAALAVLLAAVCLAAPVAERASLPPLDPGQVAALARQLTNELAEAVAEAAGDESARMEEEVGATTAVEVAAAMDGGSGTTSASGIEADIARVTHKSNGDKMRVAEKALVTEDTFASDPVRLTINLLVGDRPRGTEMGLVGDVAQATHSAVVGDSSRMKEKQLSFGKILTSVSPTVTTNPSMEDETTVHFLKPAKSEDPSNVKSVINFNALKTDTALVTGQAIESNDDLMYHKNLVHGKGLSGDKTSMNKALGRYHSQAKDTQNNVQALVYNNAPVSFKLDPTGEILVSDRPLVNANELGSDKALINKKEEENDKALVNVRGNMGNDEVIVTIEALVRNKDLTTVKSPIVNHIPNNDRKLSKENTLSNAKGFVGEMKLHVNKPTEGIKNLVNDEIIEVHNPTTSGHKDTTLLKLSNSGLAYKTSVSSSTAANTLMEDNQSSTTTPTATMTTSRMKINTSPSLDDLITSTPSAICVLTTHPISSCQTTKSVPERSVSTTSLISKPTSRSTPIEQVRSTFSLRNNELQDIGDKSSRQDAMLVSEGYEDNSLSLEEGKRVEEGRRRVRRQNGDYDPEEIGRQLAIVLGQAANAKRVTGQETAGVSDTESLEEKSLAGNRRSRQEKEVMEDEVTEAAGPMALAKDIVAPTGQAAAKVASGPENAAASDEDASDFSEDRAASAAPDLSAMAMAAGDAFSSPAAWAARGSDGWQTARSRGAEVTYHAPTSDVPQPLRALAGVRGSRFTAKVNEEPEFSDAFHTKARKDGGHSKKLSKVNVPWLIDADGDHIMLVPNDPSTSAKPPSEQSHPPRSEMKTADTATETTGWRHGHPSSTGNDPKPALLSNLKKLEQELNRQRAYSLGKESEEPKSMTLKLPIAVFDVKDSKDVILMIEGKGNATMQPILTDINKSKCKDEIKKVPESSKPDIRVKEPTGIEIPKDKEKSKENRHEFQDQKNPKKVEQEKIKSKPIVETSKAQPQGTKPRTEPEKTNKPDTPSVMIGNLTGKCNTTFIQRTLIETAVVPGPDGGLTANTAILMHQAFEQPAETSNAKTSLSTKNKTTAASTNTSSSFPNWGVVSASNVSQTSRPNSTKSEPVCVARGRMPEMLPVDDGTGSGGGDGEASIDLGAPGTLSGRPRVSNAGASGVLPPKGRGSKSDASSQDGEDDDVVRGRPMGIAARASGGSVGGGRGRVTGDEDAHRRKDPLTVGDAGAIDLGVPGGLRGRQQISNEGTTGTLRVFKKIREKQKEDAAGNEDASTAANVLSGVADESEQKRPVSGVVRSKGERSRARVQMAAPETGVLYGGDSGPEVVVTDGPAAVPRVGDAPGGQAAEGGDDAAAASVGDWVRPAPPAKPPEEEEAVREQADQADNTLGRPSGAGVAEDSQLAEALGIQEPSTATGEPGSPLSTLGRWGEDAGAGARSRHKRPHAPPSLLILPDDRLEMDVGVSLQSPPDEPQDTPR